MTPDEVRALGDRKLDATIAAALGWKNVHLCEVKESGLGFAMTTDYAGEYDGGAWRVPKYSADLNEMHHAESMLTPEQWVIYIRECINFNEIYKHNARSDFGVKAREYCINRYRAAINPKECSDALLHTMAGAFSIAILSPRQRAEALVMALMEEAKP
jgi:hypothetical protein